MCMQIVVFSAAACSSSMASERSNDFVRVTDGGRGEYVVQVVESVLHRIESTAR